MRHLLVILFSISVTSAGVQKLQTWDEQTKLDQFAKLCLSGEIPERGRVVNGERIFCKIGSGSHRRDFVHKVTKDLGESPPQAVFVQPPPLELTHNLTILGKVQSGKTSVYVVPGTVDNKYSVKVTSVKATPEKPTVFYLHNSTSTIADTSGGWRYRRTPSDAIAFLGDKNKNTSDSTFAVPQHPNGVSLEKEEDSRNTTSRVRRHKKKAEPAFIILLKS